MSAKDRLLLLLSDLFKRSSTVKTTVTNDLTQAYTLNFLPALEVICERRTFGYRIRALRVSFMSHSIWFESDR